MTKHPETIRTSRARAVSGRFDEEFSDQLLAIIMSTIAEACRLSDMPDKTALRAPEIIHALSVALLVTLPVSSSMNDPSKVAGFAEKLMRRICRDVPEARRDPELAVERFLELAGHKPPARIERVAVERVAL
jgi:hypothetical protein